MPEVASKKASVDHDVQAAAFAVGNLTTSLFTAAGVRFQNSVASASFTTVKAGGVFHAA